MNGINCIKSTTCMSTKAESCQIQNYGFTASVGQMFIIIGWQIVALCDFIVPSCHDSGVALSSDPQSCMSRFHRDCDPAKPPFVSRAYLLVLLLK